ncbi:hypothetical protein D3C79_874190 [compost metagenome]
MELSSSLLIRVFNLNCSHIFTSYNGCQCNEKQCSHRISMLADHAFTVEKSGGSGRLRVEKRDYPFRNHPPWHFLNFCPEPQGQGSLRPTAPMWERNATRLLSLIMLPISAVWPVSSCFCQSSSPSKYGSRRLISATAPG